MASESGSVRSISLELQLEEHWTLHHVLLQRIEQEVTAPEREPPTLEVYQAFERVDAGTTNFTVAQLEAVRDVVANYHHRTDHWQFDRPQLESLLAQITTALEEPQSLES